MLNIFSLEDDLFQQGRLERAVAACVQSGQIRYRHFETFGKPDQLLAAIKETGNHQVFFLDIEIRGEEQKGMEVARAIRQRDPHAIIVFVTTHSEFMPVTYRYRVSALDFIDKALPAADYEEAIASVLEHAQANVSRTVSDDAFVIKNDYAHVQVPFADILYFETSSTVHKVILTTKTGSLEFYGKVSEIAKLDDRLYQCHRAFVVNPANVTKLDRASQTVHFETGDSCLVSRLKTKGLIERLEQHG
ncbi:LytTR family transcriptional regulator DNA-binding domain-containing protein [Streptococcus entericus]|uniref:response regulator transcription factor n=1 Tax=Streptococcus entericus TaxID=155680 RepID=UPI0003745BDC|nr:response regulator transcription factor [Streptococcus entericus]